MNGPPISHPIPAFQAYGRLSPGNRRCQGFLHTGKGCTTSPPQRANEAATFASSINTYCSRGINSSTSNFIILCTGHLPSSSYLNTAGYPFDYGRHRHLHAGLRGPQAPNAAARNPNTNLHQTGVLAAFEGIDSRVYFILQIFPVGHIRPRLARWH